MQIDTNERIALRVKRRQQAAARLEKRKTETIVMKTEKQAMGNPYLNPIVNYYDADFEKSVMISGC